jgi:capsular exopolysaccharide synthesis family protein
MSKFFEALERAETEQAREARAPSAGSTDDLSAAPAPVAPSRAAEPAAPDRVTPPVVGPPARATAPAIDRAKDIGVNLVSLLDPASFEAEQYRMLRHVVETLRKGANLQVVAVTSPGAGDGKTTTAINLAGALAQSAEARVLLVDLDIRRPAVARQLGLAAAKRTLVDALLDGRLTLDDIVEHLAHFNLSVVPAGGPALAPYEVLKSPRLETLLDEARQRYDYVVVDTPPFVPVPDGRVIAKYVDGFLIVVAAHRTPRGELAHTLDLMDTEKAVGLVFNGDNLRRSSYYNVYTAPPRASRWRRAWGKS